MDNASFELVNLISDMLQWNPQKRPTASKILSHSYFSDINTALPKTLTAGPDGVVKEESPKNSQNKDDLFQK